jgi:hypothetical protein
MLRDKVTAIETQMVAKLEEIRRTFSQGGDKGTAVENAFRQFLREYLPRRLDVGAGEIVDSKNHRSTQTDIVIVDEDHPHTFTADQPGLFFIEGVSAAGEAKTIVTSEELERTIENSFRFKQLEMMPGLNTLTSSNPSDLGRFYKCPPYFLVSFESQLDMASVLDRIETFLKKKGLGVDAVNTVLDAVFILDKGWAMNFGDGQGSLQFVLSGKDELAKGWVQQNSNQVLFELISWLSVVMPKQIRFQPILNYYSYPHGV